MFCYMQEDLPELLQQANKAQAPDTTQTLKEMNQKIKEKEHTRAEQAQQRKDFSKAMKDVKKENHAHAEKVVEIKTHLATIEMKSAQAETALARRLQQLTQITDPITQTDFRAEAQMMAGELEREIYRLNGEIEKHDQFEKTQIEELQRASKQRDTASSEGTPSLQIETKEMETQRESNKEQLISRRKNITTFLRATELYSAAEQKDREKAAEILEDLHTTALALGETKTKALKLIDRYNAAYTEIEKTREVTKNATNQFEENPTKDIATKTHG